jgi:CheY-specific phosphatase CheX
MTIKFLGQFLIEQGEIEIPQLREALDLMELENQILGELAVAAGFASEADCRRVNGEQRRLDRPFGELAVEMGVLGSDELDELLQRQKANRLEVSDALLRLGHVVQDRMAVLVDQFKQEQAPYAFGGVDLPDGLRGNRPARFLVDLLPRFCERVAGLEVKMKPPRTFTQLAPRDFVASLVVIARPGVEMALVADRGVGEKLTSGISGLDLSDLPPELAVDALGEFLNVLAGNVMAALEREEGLESRLEAPRFGVLPREGFEFELVTLYGGASFVLAPR